MLEVSADMRMLLQQVREARKLTQRQLADASGIPQQTISSLENGSRTDPRLSTLRGLADALGCEIDDLYEEEKNVSGID